MKVFYATFGCGSVLANHILKITAYDEAHAREQLHESRLLEYCIAFVYDEAKGLELITKYQYTVINGKLI